MANVLAAALTGKHLIVASPFAIDVAWGTDAHKLPLYGLFSHLESDNQRIFASGDVLRIENVVETSRFISVDLSSEKPDLDRGLALSLDVWDGSLPCTVAEFQGLLAKYFVMKESAGPP